MVPKLWYPYLSLVLWALGIENSKDYRTAWTRMYKVYTNQVQRRNNRFLFEHFKDMYNIVTFHLAGQQRPSLKTRVKLDGRGLPTILPWPLRLSLLNKERVPSMVILTLFGVHRVIGWWPKVDLGTILDRFSGLSPTLDVFRIRKAIKNLKSISTTRFRFVKVMKSIELRSSGPNGKDALFQVFNDAFALWQNPRYLIDLMRLYWTYKGSLKYIISLVIILVSFTPYIAISSLLGKKWYLGRLAVVKNVAGKSRIVAMTNYWVQMALWPIHNSIFKYLKCIPSDGTFNQLAPVKKLMGDEEFYSSYDLSAATDRLPLDFQLQVMTELLGKRDANLWARIINIPFLYNGNLIKYSVGQPMGAFSSWASLAISHHIIVQMCCEKPISNYAIVGDDCIVPANIGIDYLEIMNTLGVKISLQKSFLNSRWVEFAKRTINLDTGNDFSCIGPRLIFNSISNTYYRSHIILDLAMRKVFDIRVLASKLRNIGNDISRFGLILLAGPSGLLMKNGLSFIDWLGLSRRDISAFVIQHPKGSLLKILSNSVIAEVIRNHTAKVEQVGREFKRLIPRLWRKLVSLYSWPLSTLMIVFVWFTPGPWIILKSYFKVWLEKSRDLENITYEEAMSELKDIMFSQLDTLESRVRKDYLGSTRRISTTYHNEVKVQADISEREAKRVREALKVLQSRNLLFSPGSHHGMISSADFKQATSPPKQVKKVTKPVKEIKRKKKPNFKKHSRKSKA